MALIVNLEVFLADNRVRRSAGSFALNYQGTGAWTQTQFSLAPAETRTVTAPAGGASSTVMRVSSPVEVDLTLSNPDHPSGHLSVSKALLLDASVQQMVITNAGSAVSQVVLFQC
jgi:hypothetical protein